MARRTSTETGSGNNTELILALDLLEKEKGIKKEIILDAIKVSLETAYKKNFTKEDKGYREEREEGERHKEDISVTIDSRTGAVEVFAKKTVVEHVEEGVSEISLVQARKIDERYQLGDIVNVMVTPKDFCRIAAQHARSVIVQKIKEAERQTMYDNFRSKEREVITGVVQRIEQKTYTDREDSSIEHVTRRVIVSLDAHTEVALVEKECVQGENFAVGEHIKLYVVEVKENTKGPHIVVSRTHPELVKRLLEREVAEIAEGIVEIKSVAREAGSRSKIAVWAKDEEIDAVGACVGLNGARINAIVSDLKGEKIDVINWDPDPVVLIGNALSPSKVVSVKVCLEDKSAKVVVPDYQLSLAIGKKGQNASLAARLTGYKIDIKSESQMLEETQEEDKLYIGKGEYLKYNADGTLKEEVSEDTLTTQETQVLEDVSTEPENVQPVEETETKESEEILEETLQEEPEKELVEVSEEEFVEFEELEDEDLLEFEEIQEEE